MKFKTFNPLNVSSKFAICGLPIRVDFYKTCSFGCKYCFSENRKVMAHENEIQVANLKQLETRLNRIFNKKNIKEDNFLDNLIANNVTWHGGGMSDPFQPCEKQLQITKKALDITNQYGIKILFSTKSNTVYDCDIRPELHSFQLSVTNVEDRKDIEPNVPSIESRYKFYRELKDKGFKVGIRIQPFIPNVSTLKILEMFKDADNFTLEGIKIVPQNKEHKEFILSHLNLNKEDFTQMGLLNLKPTIRLELYKPFIEFFKENNIPYSVADNDLRWLSTNNCCCGDRLIDKSTTFNTTAMIKKYGLNYKIVDVKNEYEEYKDCKCNTLFTSNRQEGCKTVDEFYEKRFERKTSPFSYKYQYVENKE